MLLPLTGSVQNRLFSETALGNLDVITFLRHYIAHIENQ